MPAKPKKESNVNVVIGLLIFVLFMALMVFWSTIGQVDAAGAREILLRAGYSEITINGRSYLSCGVDYNFHTDFTARNGIGELVNGSVCANDTAFSHTIKVD